MDKPIELLVINPGSTSTKLSIFVDGEQVHRKNLSHSIDQIKKYPVATDQCEFRRADIEAFLNEIGYDKHRLTAIASRGGSLPPVHMGAYKVNDEMVEVLYNRPHGQHASSCGAIIALAMARELGIDAYTYDGNTADEFLPISRLSGMPEISRLSLGHFLNTKAVGRMYAESIGKRYEDLVLIIVHMGGGISHNLHDHGRIIDVHTDEDGTYSPERSGAVPSGDLIKLCFSGKYTQQEMLRKVRGGGGLTAYLGTNDAREVEDRVTAGDKYATFVVQGMALQTAKFTAAMAAHAKGKVDAIILTGGIARFGFYTAAVKEYISWIAPVEIIPGEFENEALAAGVTRVLKGEEPVRDYHEFDTFDVFKMD